MKIFRTPKKTEKHLSQSKGKLNIPSGTEDERAKAEQ